MWNTSFERDPSFGSPKRFNAAKLVISVLVLFTISFCVNDEPVDGGKEGLMQFDSWPTAPRLLGESSTKIQSDETGTTEVNREHWYHTIFDLSFLRFSFLTLFGVLLTLLVRPLIGNNGHAKTNISEQSKPIMHTFFEPVGEEGCCGMTNQEHDDLLAVWKKSWEDKGWETKILTKEDAQTHPKFDEYDKTLVKFIGGSINDDYNRRCFWRWLAMVQVGGGWMSDYDTFPLELDAKLGKQLAKEEPKFKSYCYTAPCLIHASASEWDRVISSMMDILPDMEEKNAFISDMTVFDQLGRSVHNEKLWALKTLPRFRYVIQDDGSLLVDCRAYANKLAVHLCHHSVHVAVAKNSYPLSLALTRDTKEAVERRAEAAAVLMADYDKQCNMSSD